jgi:hypothetical protein
MKPVSALLCVAFLTAAAAGAEEPSFEALGQAPVVGGDRVRAKERALDDAMRQAVEQAAQTVLDPQALVARQSDLKLRIYPRARTYVASYRVLDEGETAGAFQMHISAQVAVSRLAKDLAASAPPPLPRLSSKLRGVVCARVSGDAAVITAVTGDAEKAMREQLAARGVETIAGPATCTEAAAAEAARVGAAQAALVAAIDVSAAGSVRGTDRVAAKAKVMLRMVEPEGRASGAEDAEREAYAPSLERAAATAAREALTAALLPLAPKLVHYWAPSAPQGGVMVKVSRINKHADYVAVVRALAALPGVTGVDPRRFARGEAELNVRTNVAAAQLAASLGRLPPAGIKIAAHPMSDGGLGIEITSGADSTEGG